MPVKEGEMEVELVHTNEALEQRAHPRGASGGALFSVAGELLQQLLVGVP